MGSLNINFDDRNVLNDKPTGAYKRAYLATFRAIVLFERGQGVSIEEVERKWNITGLDGIEERWRDTNLWLLSGLSEILDLRCFYYHLQVECGADQERTQRVKQSLRIMREYVFELLEQLKHCSPLGSFLSHLRHFYKTKTKTKTVVGYQTIRHLEKVGITNLQDLLHLQEKDLIELGINRIFAKQINNYVLHRFRV